VGSGNEDVNSENHACKL